MIYLIAIKKNINITGIFTHFASQDSVETARMNIGGSFSIKAVLLSHSGSMPISFVWRMKEELEPDIKKLILD